MTIFEDWQFEIDDGAAAVPFGAGTPYRVFEFSHDKPGVRATLSPRAREDGTNRGRDYLSGTTAGFVIGVDTGDAATVLDAVAALRTLWYGDLLRRTPGARLVLRAKRPGRDTARTYGRPGAFQVASLADVAAGYVPVVCEFDCDDGYFYSDVEYTLSVPFIPNQLNGLTGTLTGPWTTTASGTASGQLDVAGDCPAWLGWRPHGPISNPEIEVVGRWSATLSASVAHDMSVTVDPSPWVRSARGVDGANFAGKLTAGSTRMSQMRVPPGGNQVLLRGVDATGTSYMDLFWRAVWASY